VAETLRANGAYNKSLKQTRRLRAAWFCGMFWGNSMKLGIVLLFLVVLVSINSSFADDSQLTCRGVKALTSALSIDIESVVCRGLLL
jgi:zinc transporter ZupT